LHPYLKGCFVIDHLGELAALATSLCFSFGSTLFTLSGREIGSQLVNRTRLLVALLMVMGLHWLTLGAPFPPAVDASQWWWLGLSGFIGLGLGDMCLMQAFVMVGPRLSMLMMALSPAMSAVLAWIVLGEVLTAADVLFIVIITVGIASVVSERPTKTNGETSANTPANRQHHIAGLLFAFGGAVGQSVGLIFSKIGLENDFPALSGSVIRLAVAMVLFWALTILRGKLVSSFQTLRVHPRAVRLLTAGAFFGPALGVWLSLVAVQRAPVGVASTLMSLTPIFLLPISYFVFGERITPRAVVGTIIAFIGTALLFL
jgi:drug/metabolite transporter (DMT)-like permease